MKREEKRQNSKRESDKLRCIDTRRQRDGQTNEDTERYLEKKHAQRLINAEKTKNLTDCENKRQFDTDRQRGREIKRKRLKVGEKQEQRGIHADGQVHRERDGGRELHSKKHSNVAIERRARKIKTEKKRLETQNE